jgi:hypothetical protein
VDAIAIELCVLLVLELAIELELGDAKVAVAVDL